MTRRTLLRRGGTAAVGAAAVGTGAHQLEISPVGNSEAAICGGVCIATTAVVGAGLVGYSLGRQSAPKPDVSAEEEEADWENWVDIYARASDISTHDTSQLEQARRDANGMANLARRDAILAIYNEAVSGSDKSEGATAAEDAVNGDFTETEKGVWNHWAARSTEWAGDYDILMNNFNSNWQLPVDAWDPVAGEVVSMFDRWMTEDTGVSNGPSMDQNRDVTLPDGTTVSVPFAGPYSRNDNSAYVLFPDPGEMSAFEYSDADHPEDLYDDTEVSGGSYHTDPVISEPDPSQFDAVNEDEVDMSDFDGDKRFLNSHDFYALIQEIEEIRQNTLEEVDQLVDIHFEAAQNGNISLPEMTASQGLLESARNADSFREIALTFRTMGWATADTATVISFEGEETERVEVDSKLAWARQDQPDPLPVGSTIDAGNLPGTLYVAYNYEDENGETAATYNVITGEFTIEATEDGSGEVGFEHRGVVDTSMDPDDVQDEFRQSNDAQQDAEEARQDINVEGSSLFGGGFSFGDSGLSLPTLIGKIAGFPIWLIAVVVALLYNKLSN